MFLSSFDIVDTSHNQGRFEWSSLLVGNNYSSFYIHRSTLLFSCKRNPDYAVKT